MMERIHPLLFETLKKIVDIIPEDYTKITAIVYEHDDVELENGINVRVTGAEMTFPNRQLLLDYFPQIRNPKNVIFKKGDWSGEINIYCLGREVTVTGRPPSLTYADFERIDLAQTGREYELRKVTITW